MISVNRRLPFVSSLLAALLIMVACARAGESIVGRWENADRAMIILERDIRVEYKDPGEVKALEGEYSRKGDILSIRFDEYVDAGNNPRSLAGTALDGMTEKLKIWVKDGRLFTKVLSTSKVYEYERIGG